MLFTLKFSSTLVKDVVSESAIVDDDVVSDKFVAFVMMVVVVVIVTVVTVVFLIAAVAFVNTVVAVEAILKFPLRS